MPANSAINSRQTPIRPFYANLKVFFNYYEEKWFPYTMPISDINGLRVAIENIEADSEIYERHARIAKATRAAIVASGLKLYANSGYSILLVCSLGVGLKASLAETFEANL